MAPHEENPLAGPDAPGPTRQFYSVGFLCQQLQQLPPNVMAIAKSAGVEPAMYVDAVPYFRGNDVQTMAAHVASVRRDVQNQVTSN